MAFHMVASYIIATDLSCVGNKLFEMHRIILHVH